MKSVAVYMVGGGICEDPYCVCAIVRTSCGVNRIAHRKGRNCARANGVDG